MLPNEASRFIFSTYTENRVKSVLFMLGALLILYSKLCFIQISHEMFSLICHRHHQLKISRQTEEMEDGLCCASMSLKTWKKFYFWTPECKLEKTFKIFLSPWFINLCFVFQSALKVSINIWNKFLINSSIKFLYWEMVAF